MSRQTVILCDMCGEEVLSWRIREESAQIKLWAPGEHRSYGGQRIDLCTSCYGKFVDFLDRGAKVDDL